MGSLALVLPSSRRFPSRETVLSNGRRNAFPRVSIPNTVVRSRRRKSWPLKPLRNDHDNDRKQCSIARHREVPPSYRPQSRPPTVQLSFCLRSSDLIQTPSIRQSKKLTDRSSRFCALDHRCDDNRRRLSPCIRPQC